MAEPSFSADPPSEQEALDAYSRAVIAVADELETAAELVMGKIDAVPVAIVRGYAYTPANGSARELIRAPEKDLFR